MWLQKFKNLHGVTMFLFVCFNFGLAPSKLSLLHFSRFLCMSVCECWKMSDSHSVVRGEIQSPQYPLPYPTSLKEWNLLGPEGYQIQLSITHLDIKASARCYQDSLTVRTIFQHKLYHILNNR